MIKKVLLGMMFCILFIVGCGKKEKVENINITYVKAPLNIPSILEKNMNMFDKEFEKDNIKVNFYELTTGPEQTNALAAGELDFLHALGGTSAIIAASNGVDLKITNVYSRSPKGFMLLTKNSDINSAADLVGKKVAGPKGTILHQVLVGYLTKNGYKENDVEFINMKLPDAMAALETGNVDAALLAGPVALKAIKNGANVITDGERLTQGLIVTAVSGKFLKENPDLVKRFVSTNEKAVNFIGTNFDETIDIVAKDVGLTKDQVMELYPLYDFNTKITPEDIKDLEDTQEFLIQNGMQKNKVNIQELIVK
ncbi:NrtA/SsuA/CpmA family ABC transporter substrate-binding protein [Fusobacterium hominis]|uniref:NrtA/SsuA/CpmA family ABC transporter substrate-binding protein n=1 Tax=Fusobacterium hominis TaxID=2764326 RepID=A0A7G9GXD8_9FUSO|nr:NrtA/SsuA/CpmA family ABC transporter substrate-binding protein [Fusobacterium hominis]QNM15470.1 NrtA/SsuA/CpmA family ABC transporter substrate-binding protein [Fusobacterium hominis]